MKDGLLPFVIFLAIMLFFLLRKGKKQGSSAPERPPYAKAPPPKPSPTKGVPSKSLISHKKATKRLAVAYEVEKKKAPPILQTNWQDKGSLKQAFILSEVLKKVDERELF